MKKNKFLFIWADSSLTTKSNHVNSPYHFIHLGEVVDYVEKNIGGIVDILDIEAEQIEFQTIMNTIIKNKYKAIAFYLNTENLQNSIKLLDFIKEINPKCKTIAYGEMPIFLPKFFRNTKFDAIVDRQCDQEVSILDFFNYSINEVKEDNLRGIILIKNKQLIFKRKGVFLSPNEWGFANEKKIPIDSYFSMSKKKQFVLTLSRGCPFDCPYCNAVLYYGMNERRRNTKDIIDFINEHDYEYYKFFAPNFTLNEKMAIELCYALISNEKQIKWSCTTRPDLLQNENLIKIMAKSGCYKIAVGIESIMSEDLKNINKRYDENLILEGIKLLKKYNIEYKALIMFGVPNQTKQSIKYTLDFLKKNGLKVRPTAYTPFYEMNQNMTAEQISRYDKRTYYEGIDGLSYGDFLKLIYDIDNYDKIL